jgi:hypothetical protein
VNSKINKVDLIIQIIIAAIILGIAYVIGYPSGKRLMVIGVVVIIFGYWWGYHYGWMLDGSEQIIERWKQLEEKYQDRKDISILELMSLSFRNSFFWFKILCLILGIIILIFGFMILLMKG